MAMVLGSRLRGGSAARAVSGYRAARLVRLRPLSRAVPLSQAFVRWDAEGFGLRRRGGPLPDPDAGRGPGVRRRCYERVYVAQVWDPYAPLGWLVGVEPPDPRFNKVF